MLVFMVLAIMLMAGCGKSDTGSEPGDPHKKTDSTAPEAKTGPEAARDGESATRKPHGPGGPNGPQTLNGVDLDKVDISKLDLDKLGVPERMKEAIKSGRIPKERVIEFLKMRRDSAGTPSVSVEPVQKKAIHSFLSLNGVVEPERKVEVYSRLSAYVKEVIREEGDFVKKDQILARLDDNEIVISFRQAELQLQQADVVLKDEQANYERSKELKKTDLISEKEYQLSEANYHKARLELLNKQENFKNLEIQLNYTAVRAPAEGYVTQRTIEVGQRVSVNQIVYTVEDFNPLLIPVHVPSSDVNNLKKGMEVEITTNVLPGMIFMGRIKMVNPRVDQQSGTVKTTVEVEDKSLKLKPGMFVETRILVGNKADALVIPIKSITYRQGASFVFVMNRGQVSRRDIVTGVSEGEYVEVLEGLAEGERIVTVGAAGLKDQMRVSVTL